MGCPCRAKRPHEVQTSAQQTAQQTPPPAQPVEAVTAGAGQDKR